MKLSVKEAATHLGRSERAVRSALTAGRLKGYKHQGRWVIPRRNLPLTDAERARVEATVDDLHAAVDAAVPDHIAREIGAHGLAGLRAHRAARAVFDALDGSPAAQPIGDTLREAIRALAEGHHQYARPVKIESGLPPGSGHPVYAARLNARVERRRGSVAGFVARRHAVLARIRAERLARRQTPAASWDGSWGWSTHSPRACRRR